MFCGVHFMAESADILTGPHQQVILPDLAAGCSMADMATAEQVARAWDDLVDAGVADGTVPVSYMNSSAAIKSFTGEHGGTICTSSNARRALDWAFGAERGGERVLFLPDQHLGRNTAVGELGFDEADCVVYDPRQPQRRPHGAGAARRPDDPVARALLGARPVQPVLRGRGSRPSSRRDGARAPRVQAGGRHRG